jgi:hypothetical protein
VGWGSEGSAATGGEKPVYQFVLPTLTSGVAPDLKDLFRETLRVARGIQFTKKEQRSKFDALGRMAVETQILCWHNEIGYAILVVPGYSPTDATCRALAETEKAGGITKPVTFSVVAEKQENKKVMKVDPKAENASWDTFAIKGQLDASASGNAMYASFMEGLARDKIGFANVLKAFMVASDFNGLPLPSIRELLPKYGPLIAR